MQEPTVIYEDKNFLAINKPAGLLVHRNGRLDVGSETLEVKRHKRGVQHPTPNLQPPTLVDWLLVRYPEIKTVGDDLETRPGIVHRLDRGTSGVMVVARNQPYFEYLKSLFQKHLVKKVYLALVFGELKDKRGRIEKPIGIRTGTLKRSLTSKKMLKEAVTDYRLVKTFRRSSGEALSLVAVEPKTGRTHQIRVHLASIGHPVVGDRLYGPRRQPPWVERMMLHAMSLEFPPAEGRSLRIEAEAPPDYKKVIDDLD